MNIETKIRNIRFIGELCKFRIAPASTVFSCLKEINPWCSLPPSSETLPFASSPNQIVDKWYSRKCSVKFMRFSWLLKSTLC
uniref:Uncharacterized protein n=1 Tax=Salix viminalis TaxID=40686 RepID=A0A6N2KZY0_SALVM